MVTAERSREHPARRAHGDRRRDPRPGARQARQPTSRSRSSAARRVCARGGDHAHRAVRDPATRSRPSRVCWWARGPQRSRSDGSPRCEIVDAGHKRELDIALELPDGELEAVMPRGADGATCSTSIAPHGEATHTTLIFVNTRRMAERVAHNLLAERLGEEHVAAHHGSLSKERRLRVEARLRAGDLQVRSWRRHRSSWASTWDRWSSSCQLGSPRSIDDLPAAGGPLGTHALAGTSQGPPLPD